MTSVSDQNIECPYAVGIQRTVGKRRHQSLKENQMSEIEYKTMIVPCKRCGKRVERNLPTQIYEIYQAIAEENGETVEFTSTCQSCRGDDPFLRMLNEANIPTIGRDFTEEP